MQSIRQYMYDTTGNNHTFIYTSENYTRCTIDREELHKPLSM